MVKLVLLILITIFVRGSEGFTRPFSGLVQNARWVSVS